METQNCGIIMHVLTNWLLSRVWNTYLLLLTTSPTYSRWKYGDTTNVWGDSDTEVTDSGVLKSCTMLEKLRTLFKVYIYEKKIETR